VSHERGQSTVEWVGLVFLVALALAFTGAVAGVAVPGAALAQAISSRIVCALELSGPCEPATDPLVTAYGGKVAALLRERTLPVRYEEGMRLLPVDYRECRDYACAEGAERIRVSKTEAGLPVSAFAHVVDCRRKPAIPEDAECSGDAAGNLYLQYWFYYPSSATGEGSTPLKPVIREVSGAIGKPSYHPDDWESLQLRIEPDGQVYARASAHHAYGIGWLPLEFAGFTVSGGSHAGTVRPADFARVTPARRLTLIPLEPIAASEPGAEFAVTPPWRKRVWLDPEYHGTD